MPDFDGGVYITKYAQSTSIDYNNGTITQAKITLTITKEDPIEYTIYLSANGGTNWEEVSDGVLYTFVNTGTDLRWKIVGAGNFSITNITINSYH